MFGYSARLFRYQCRGPVVVRVHRRYLYGSTLASGEHPDPYAAVASLGCAGWTRLYDDVFVRPTNVPET